MIDLNPLGSACPTCQSSSHECKSDSFISHHDLFTIISPLKQSLPCGIDISNLFASSVYTRKASDASEIR